MQKSLPAFLAIFALCAAAIAQDAPAGPDTAKIKTASKKPAYVPTATPNPAATSSPEPGRKSPGVLEILFGSRRKRPQGATQPMPAPKVVASTPAPAMPQPEAVPAPKPKIAKTKPHGKTLAADATPHAKKHTPKAKPAEAEPEPALAKTEPPAAAPDKPEPPAPPAPAPIKKGRKGKTAPVVAAHEAVEPPPDADPETKEKFRFDQAKAKASADPEVMELKAAADSAVSEEDTRSAQRAYNKALFGKMRKIDGTLDERINSMEAAILKKLDGK